MPRLDASHRYIDTVHQRKPLSMTRKITATAAVLALLATGCSASTDSSAPGGTLITGGASAATSTPTPSSTTPAPATTTAGRTPTVAEVTASPSAEASTTAASTIAASTPTPTVSLDPSPLAGTGGGPHSPPAFLPSTASLTKTAVVPLKPRKQLLPPTPAASRTRNGQKSFTP